jgi:hypothetical protein
MYLVCWLCLLICMLFDWLQAVESMKSRCSGSNIMVKSNLLTKCPSDMHFEHCKYGFAYPTANPNKRPKHQILYNLQESSIWYVAIPRLICFWYVFFLAGSSRWTWHRLWSEFILRLKYPRVNHLSSWVRSTHTQKCNFV